MDDFHPCPFCPSDFTTLAALIEHHATCQPPVPPSEKTKRADPGRALEKLVLASAGAQKDQRLHLIKVPPPVSGKIGPGGRITGRVTGKGGLDFVGHMAGRHVELDAKSTAITTRFDLANIESHQIGELHRRHEEGAVALLLIEFRNLVPGPRYFAIDWTRMPPDLDRASVPLDYFLTSCPEVKRVGKLLDLAGVVRQFVTERAIAAGCATWEVRHGS